MSTDTESDACEGSNWTGVSLDEFLSCRHNLAHDRQTRMLADLAPLGCYNSSVLPPVLRRRLLLRSAAANLRQMAFFGLTERLDDTAALFQHRFGVRFDADLRQNHQLHTTLLSYHGFSISSRSSWLRSMFCRVDGSTPGRQ